MFKPRLKHRTLLDSYGWTRHIAQEPPYCEQECRRLLVGRAPRFAAPAAPTGAFLHFTFNVSLPFDMTTMVVTYAGDATTQFDRDYYLLHHLLLVQKAWGPYGMQSTAAFFPAGSDAGIIAVAICVFHDEAALQASLASPQTPAVMADVARFTDIKPVQSRVVPI